MNSHKYLLNRSRKHHPSDKWELQRVISLKTIGFALVFVLFLSWSSHNTGLDKATVENVNAILSLFGITESKVVSSASGILKKVFTVQVASRIEIDRLDDFNRNNLPCLSHLEVFKEKNYETMTGTYTIEKVEYLVSAFGYLFKILIKKKEPPFDITCQPMIFPVHRSASLSVMERSETGSLLAMAYSNMRGYGDVHPTVDELRIGYLPVEVLHPITRELVEIGHVLMTECEVIAMYKNQDKTGENMPGSNPEEGAEKHRKNFVNCRPLHSAMVHVLGIMK